MVSVKLDWFVVNCFLDDCKNELENCDAKEKELIEKANKEFSDVHDSDTFHLSDDVFDYFMETLNAIASDYYHNIYL